MSVTEEQILDMLEDLGPPFNSIVLDFEAQEESEVLTSDFQGALEPLFEELVDYKEDQIAIQRLSDVSKEAVVQTANLLGANFAEKDFLYAFHYLLSELQFERYRLYRAKHGMSSLSSSSSGNPKVHASVLNYALSVLEPVRGELEEGTVEGGVFFDPSTLSPDELDKLEQMNALFQQDMQTRRETSLQRLDVSIQSFLWSSLAKDKETAIVSSIENIRRVLSPSPLPFSVIEDLGQVPVDRLLAFHSAPSSTPSFSLSREEASADRLVKGVMVGEMPDRGGRVNESRPAPILERRGGRGGRGRGGRGRGRGRGRGGRGKGKQEDRTVVVTESTNTDTSSEVKGKSKKKRKKKSKKEKKEEDA